MNDNGLRIHDGRSRMDKAIDRAVRDMTSVDPPPGLRRRVFARLSEPSAPSPFRWQMAFAAASVAVLILTFALWRAQPPAVHTPADIRASADPASPTPQPPTIPQTTPAVQPAPVTETPVHDGRAAERPRIRMTNPFSQPGADRITAANVDAKANVDALPPEPRADALVPPQPLEILPLTIKPISVEPLQIAPLSRPR
jgi:hypothetical protein